ncbi:tryptophan halogenase [Alteromonadaceae bacterium 2753L.S.0a.02]|nr:tryptophan halogenase [Alteromonadaceae bacterium 2753L.S.0a.02]
MSISLAVVGDSVEAWLLAYGFALKLQPQNKKSEKSPITVLQKPLPDVATLHLSPDDLLLFEELGVSERDLIRECNGQFSLGYNYVLNDDKRYGNFFCWGSYGFKHGSLSFHQLWAKARIAGRAESFCDYCFAAHCAAEHRFVHPQTDPRSVLSQLQHSIVIDTSLLKKLLIARCISIGVKTIQPTGEITVRRDKNRVEALDCGGATEVSADFFLDFTGELFTASKSLAGHTQLPFNSVASVRMSCNDPLSYSRLQPLDGGWLRHDCLGDEQVISYLYDRGARSVQSVEDLLLQYCDTAKHIDIVNYPAEVAMAHWQGNVVYSGSYATGPSGFVHSSAHALHRQWQTLLQLLPRDDTDNQEWDVLCAEYNDFSQVLVARLAELHWLHAERSPLNDVKLQGVLQHLIALFQCRGSVMHLRENLMGDETWAKLLIALELFPDDYDPLLDGVEFDAIVDKMAMGKAALRKAAAQLPPLKVYRQHYINKHSV